MEAFSCTQPGRSVSLFSETQTVSVSSFKGRHNNVKCSVSPRNANVNGGSVAETSRSPLGLFWFVKGGRENNSIGKQSDEDSNISLLSGALDLNLRESLQEKSPIEEEDSCEQYGWNDSDDQADEGPSLGVAAGDRNGYFDELGDSDGEQGSSSVERGNWVGKILEMRSFWKDKDNCKSAAVMEPLKNQGSSSSSSCSEDGYDGVCGCCYTDDRSVGSHVLEVPRTEVKHDRNSFSGFLHRVSLSEIKFFARLSHLCNMAYKIHNVKPSELLKNHHLRFITSSLEKKMEAAKKAKELAANDLSLATSSGKNNSHSSEAKTKRRLTVSPAVAYEIAAAAASYLHSRTKYLLPFKSNNKSEHDVDENLKNGTRQAGEADQDCESPGIKAVASNEEVAIEVTPGCEYKGALMNSSTNNEFSNDISSLSKSEVASFIATSSVTAVVAAEEETKQAVANDLQSIHSSPCEWFVCDEEGTHTRLFVIQGSESFASWQANLFFEPIQFEGLDVFMQPDNLERNVDTQLKPMIEFMKALGFTGSNLGHTISRVPRLLTCNLEQNIRPKITMLVGIFGSKLNLCKALMRHPRVLLYKFDNLKPKIDILKQSSMQDELLLHLITKSPHLILRSEEALKLEIEYVRNLGILEGSKAFANALAAVDDSGLENFENKLKLLATLGLLENEIVQFVRRVPHTLANSVDKIKEKMDFLKNTAGFQPNIVVLYPRLLSYSIENRIQPRHKVIEFLRETEPSRLPRNLVTVYELSELRFADKFLMGCPEAANLFEKYKGKSVDLATS